MAGGPSIPQVLSIRLRLRGSRETSTLELAVQAAVAPDRERRAYTCAVALHADDGDLETAARLGEELLTEGYDAYLLRTMARVYWGLWRQTKDELWHDRWWRVHMQLNESAAA